MSEKSLEAFHIDFDLTFEVVAACEQRGHYDEEAHAARQRLVVKRINRKRIARKLDMNYQKKIITSFFAPQW